MSNIISRDVDGNVVLKKAAMIFHEKLAQSDGLQQAALDLLHTCKAVKESDDSKLGQDEIAMAKKLYAIRATLTDLAGASADQPSACTDLVVTRRDTWYSLWRSSNSGNKAQYSGINGCVKALFDNSNSWTSFKTHGQDANTLCEVPGTDYAARMIIDMLNDVNGIIPDWLNAFHADREEASKVLERRREILENIVELEQQLKSERLQNQKDTMAQTSDMFGQINNEFDKILKNAGSSFSDIDSGVSQLQQVCAMTLQPWIY
jgi:hypothetical protein